MAMLTATPPHAGWNNVPYNNLSVVKAPNIAQLHAEGISMPHSYVQRWYVVSDSSPAMILMLLPPLLTLLVQVHPHARLADDRALPLPHGLEPVRRDGQATPRRQAGLRRCVSRLGSAPSSLGAAAANCRCC